MLPDPCVCQHYCSLRGWGTGPGPQHPRQKSSRPRPTQTVRQGVIYLYPHLRANKPYRDLESSAQKGSHTWPLWFSTQSLKEIVQNADAQGPTQSTWSRRSGIGFRLCISNKYPCKSLREYSESLFLLSEQGEGTQLVSWQFTGPMAPPLPRSLPPGENRITVPCAPGKRHGPHPGILLCIHPGTKAGTRIYI